MNPLHSHWLRLAVWLFVASPVVAFAVALTQQVDFTFALILTLYMWALVSVILALIALAGLVLRLMHWGMRALRR
ncbi:MAG: hypothetical protein AAB349_05760 [Chloroflexota bacterium]